MFETDLDRNAPSPRVGRRIFLFTVAAGFAGEVLWPLVKPRLSNAAASKQPPQEVTIVPVSDGGQRLKAARVLKVVKTEEEWRKQLPPGVFEITRRADTEIPGSGQYNEFHEKGLYRCICCGNALFSSETKFASGTGWPSFWAPIAAENIQTTKDFSYFMIRTAVSCTECAAHLGHVFNDGPEPTYLRYCINSAALRFVALETKTAKW